MIRKQIALISGGSSGIGLACADELLKRGFAVVLTARRMDRLEAARQELQAKHPLVQDADIVVSSMDVGDIDACTAFIEKIEMECGPIEVLIASAGIAVPGLFLEQPLDQHIEQMRVNFFGSLALVHAMAKPMVKRRRGHIVLISSGAAFVGIYGYAAYAPSKFAIRGLAETLKVELAEHNVSVSVAFPPDTDTPQYAAEQASKPEVTKIISAGGGFSSPEAVAAHIIRNALAGRFQIAYGWPLMALRWVHSFYAPFFLKSQIAIARKIAGKRS